MDNSCSDGKFNKLCSLFLLSACGVSVNISELFTHGQITKPEVCKESDAMALSNTTRKKDMYDFYRNKFLDVYSTLSEEDVHEISHDSKEMIASCSFESHEYQDEHCQRLMKGIQKFFSPKHGTCYSFNFAGPEVVSGTEWHHFRPRNTSFNGPFYGLRLEINLGSNFYLRNGLTQNEGLAVVIHSPRMVPLVSNSAINVKPNTATSIELGFKSVHRQANPYPSNCSDTWKLSSYSDIHDDEISYQTNLCLSKCTSDLIQKTCQCKSIQLDEYHDEHSLKEASSNMTYCDISDRLDNKCIAGVVNSIGNETSCKCPLRCNEISYPTQVSSSRWPSKLYWGYLAYQHQIIYHGQLVEPVTIKDSLMENSPGGEETEAMEEIREYINENFLLLEVNFKSMTLERIEEVRKYDFFSFLASLGGSLSLYLGISIVAAFEVFEILLRLPYGCYKRSRKIESNSK